MYIFTAKLGLISIVLGHVLSPSKLVNLFLGRNDLRRGKRKRQSPNSTSSNQSGNQINSTSSNHQEKGTEYKRSLTPNNDRNSLYTGRYPREKDIRSTILFLIIATS